MTMTTDSRGFTTYAPTMESDSIITVKGEAFVRQYIDDIARVGGFVNRDRSIDYDDFAVVVSNDSLVKPVGYDQLLAFVGTFQPARAAATARAMRTQWAIINADRAQASREQIWD